MNTPNPRLSDKSAVAVCVPLYTMCPQKHRLDLVNIAIAVLD